MFNQSMINQINALTLLFKRVKNALTTQFLLRKYMTSRFKIKQMLVQEIFEMKR